ncbi:MAG: hypothetical protein U5K43_06690 [Halofilum sp. (in: g-proteobacteria)]|nr:hypothetical protein [Halofilum sp. (in: g-proteobacteria)]
MPDAVPDVPASDERPDYKEADANGDGQVSVSEATDVGVPKSEAKREDIDNDGKLTQADWKFVDMNGSSGGEGDSS